MNELMNGLIDLVSGFGREAGKGCDCSSHL